MTSDLSMVNYEVLPDEWMSPPRYQGLFSYQHSRHSPDGWQLTFTPAHERVTNVPLPPSPETWAVITENNSFGFTGLTHLVPDPGFIQYNTVQGSRPSSISPTYGSSPHDVTDNSDALRTHESTARGNKRRRSSDTKDQQRQCKRLKYFCYFCYKTFGYYSTFLSHLRTHSGERPFQCTSCPKTFTDRSTFIKHQRIHNGRRPYTCSLCGASFTQSGNLHRHRRRMH